MVSPRSRKNGGKITGGYLISTRAQIKIINTYRDINGKENRDEIWFYRHSDGYPSSVLPDLRKFLGWVRDGRIRDNVEQASGWLMLIGMQDPYLIENGDARELNNNRHRHLNTHEPPITIEAGFLSWKIGQYEPSVPEKHGDIEWFYIVNLTTKQILIADPDELCVYVDNDAVPPEKTEGYIQQKHNHRQTREPRTIPDTAAEMEFET